MISDFETACRMEIVHSEANHELVTFSHVCGCHIYDVIQFNMLSVIFVLKKGVYHTATIEWSIVLIINSPFHFLLSRF